MAGPFLSEPFSIHVDEAVLADLRDRIGNTRWPDQIAGIGVVIPSLPGYGFSQRPARTGVNYRHVAGLRHWLMEGLGYQRYAASGSDFGARVATVMALDGPERLLGIHVSNLEIPPYTGAGSRPLSDAERKG